MDLKYWCLTYLTRGHYTAKIDIKFKDNCWKETYVRIADRDNNHRLLNKITYFNHPTSGESKPIAVQLKFEASKIQGETQRFRAYVIVDDGFSQVNKYVQFDPKIFIYHIHFFMNTNSAACA
jgi:hypothetical protein